jgi:acetyl esterase
MRRSVTLVVTAALVTAVLIGTAAGVRADEAPRFTEQGDIVYRTVDGEPILLDAYLPATSAALRPAVVLIHGGGWLGGDRSASADSAQRLASLGFVAFSIDYRLTPAHPYPAAVDDVRAAVRWLRKPAHVAAFRIDPARIGAFGSSAGGHLAGMLATIGRGSLDRGSRVRAAVSWSGPMDFTIESATDSAVLHTPTVAAFLACTYDQPGCRAREALASPIVHVDKTDAPMLLANSEQELVPPEQARRMASALAAARVKYQLVVFPGDRHADAFADDVWADTVAFLERYLGKPPAPVG